MLSSQHFGQFQVYGYESNLTVKIDELNVGKYICRASVEGYR